MSSENFFGSKSRNEGGGGERDLDQKEQERGNDAIGQINDFFFLPQSFPFHPAEIWPQTNQMGPDGSGPQERREYNQNANNQDWLADAPMPDGEDTLCFSSTNGGPSFPVNVPKTVPSSSRAPFTLQNEDNVMRIPTQNYPASNSTTPNQTDISKMARLNLNTPSNNPSIEEILSFVGEPMPVNPDEPAVIEVFPSPDTVIKPEYFDPNEIQPWCMLTFYEFRKRLETFSAQLPSFNVDNSNTRNDEWFGLASMPMEMKASEDVKSSACRNQLGSGIKLTRDRYGAVWVTVLTEAPVFVHSRFRNMMANDPPEKVCRLQNKRMDENMVQEEFVNLKVFDNELYCQKMSRILHEEGMDKCGEYVIQYCNIRIAFCKGFGGDYVRQNASDTPCWVDIFLVGPLADHDKIVRATEVDIEIGSRS